MNLEDMVLSGIASYKKKHLREVLGVVRPIDRNRMVAARDCVEEEMGSCVMCAVSVLEILVVMFAQQCEGT